MSTGYLVLDRKNGESIIIGDKMIEIKVLDIVGGSVKLGIRAPNSISIHREEIFDKIKANDDEGKRKIQEPAEETLDNRGNV